MPKWLAALLHSPNVRRCIEMRLQICYEADVMAATARVRRRRLHALRPGRGRHSGVQALWGPSLLRA